MFKKLSALALALVLSSGCGTTAVVQYMQDNPDSDFYSAILNVAIPDVKAALADAQGHNDAIGAACWSSLDAFLATLPPTKEAPVNTGAALAIQRARDVVAGADSLIPTGVKIGCSAMVDDMKRKGIKAAAIIAAASKGGPAAAAKAGQLLP